MIHVLYPPLVEMLQRLMSTIKGDLVQTKRGPELAHIDSEFGLSIFRWRS